MVFNEKPKKGVKMAQDKGLIGPTTMDIVNWLKTEDRYCSTSLAIHCRCMLPEEGEGRVE